MILLFTIFFQLVIFSSFHFKFETLSLICCILFHPKRILFKILIRVFLVYIFTQKLIGFVIILILFLLTENIFDCLYIFVFCWITQIHCALLLNFSSYFWVFNTDFWNSLFNHYFGLLQIISIL